MRDPHLDKLIQDIKTKKFREGEAKDLTKTYGEEISKQLKPLFEEHSKAMTDSVAKSLSGLKMPDMPAMPEYKQQEIPAPVVNVPAPIVNVPPPVVNIPAPVINIPETVFPDYPEFPGSFKIDGVSATKPLHVQMVDQAGKPMMFPVSGGGAGGGRGDFFTIKDIQTSAGQSIINQTEGAVKVTGTVTVTSSNSSVHILDASNAIFGSATNPLNVAITSGAASSTKAQIGNSDGDFTAANPLPVVFSSTSSTGSALIDSSGVQYSGSNPFPVTITSGGTATSAVNVVDSSGVAFSGSNPLPVTFSAAASQTVSYLNVESALNSSVVALGSVGTFTALEEDVKDYASISISVFADQASGTDGLSIQQSSNGTNWDITDNYTISASSGKVISVQPVSRYFRIVYTNGASAQGVFRLSTVMHRVAAQPSSQRSSDAYTNETDLQQFWGFLSGYNGTNWDRLRMNTGDSAGALRTAAATDSVSSVVVNSGTVTAVTTITNSVAVVQLDRDGNPIVQGPIGNGDQATALRVVIAGDSNSSVNVQSGTINTVTSLTNFNGNAISTNQGATSPGTLRVIHAGDASVSTSTAGDIAAAATDSGNPVKVGGVAHTANPTAVTDGQRVNFTADKLGRQLTRPIQVRDLIKTAYVSLTTGTEATLLTAAAGTFADLIMITATNNSSAATQLDIRAVSAGNIVHTMYLPASTGPVGWTPPVPWPQDATGNSWTVDMPDQTGTTVYVSALFSQEI